MCKNVKDKHLEQKKDTPSKYSFSNITMLVSIIILCALNIYCALGLLDLGTYNYLIAAGSGILLILAFIFFFKNFIGWLKTDFVCVVLIALFSWGYYLFVMFGLVKYLQDENALQELIQSTGIWSYLVYVLVQFLQVTFIPIPAMITTIAGTFLFGPGMASLLSIAGIFLGSFFAFFIGDKFGEKVVKWIVGEEKTKKYSNLLYDKGKYMFFLMMLFPIFPDDILCLVAGMTSMSYRFFATTILLTRPIGIVMTCYLGSGDVIPFSGWGIPVWCVLIILMIIAFWIAYKYKDKIEIIINKFVQKIKVFVVKINNFITRVFEDFIALFSKNYKIKLLLKRNKYPLSLLPEKTETLPSDDIDNFKKLLEKHDADYEKQKELKKLRKAKQQNKTKS